MSIIRTDNLTHTYSIGTPFEKTAISDISMEIPEGDYVGIIGHTGSGKSTLLQHLNGLMEPTSGKVYIQDQDIWADKKAIRKFRFMVGLVFQYPEYQLFGETIYEDIAFGSRNMGLDEAEVENRVREAMRFVGVPYENREKSPFDMSGGQKRRIAIAGVLAMDPQVLILDEPTAGLDPKGREKILGEIREYQQERKTTILLVSHSMEDIAKNASHAMILKGGKLVRYDTTEKIFEEHELLEQMNLSVPQVTKVFMGLKQKGYDVKENTLTVEEGAAELLRLLKKDGDRT